MKPLLVFSSCALLLAEAASAAPNTGTMVFPVNPPIVASPEQKITIRPFQPEMPASPNDRFLAALSYVTKADELLRTNRKSAAALLLAQALDQLAQLKKDYPGFQSANLGYQTRKAAELYASAIAP